MDTSTVDISEMIKLVKAFKEVYFSSGPDGFKLSEIKVGEEVKFPPRSPQQRISIKDGEEDIIFALTYNGEETKQFAFNEQVFSKHELNTIADEFDFITIPHPYNPTFLIGSIQNKNELYQGHCLGAISKGKKGSYYLLIFATRGTTDFEDDIVYIHGVWKVEVTETFKTNLFTRRSH